MINILIVDQLRLFSQGIMAYLSEISDIHVVGVEKRLNQIKKMLKEEEIHVVLINVMLSTIDTYSLTFYIKNTYPNTKLIHYMNDADNELVFKSVTNGVNSILSEDIKPEHFVQAIRCALSGEAFFTGKVAKKIVNKVLDVEFDEKLILRKKLNALDIKLTPRELDVVFLIIKDYPNKIIAKELGLSEGTVKNYVSNLYRKFNKDSRQALIKYIEQL
mgnify:FL=1